MVTQPSRLGHVRFPRLERRRIVRPHALVVALVFVATLVSGCITSDDLGAGLPGDVDVDDAGATAEIPWGLVECSFLNWFPGAYKDRLAPYVAEGFEMTSRAPVTDDHRPTDTYLGFEAFSCASGAGLEGDVPGMTYASHFIGIQPNETWATPGIDQYFYKWWPLVPDADRRSWFQEHGMEAVAGELAVEGDATGRLHSASYTLEGIGSYRFTGSPTAVEPETGDGVERFGEFTPLVDDNGTNIGHAVWWSDYSVHHVTSGFGRFEVEPGSWAAEMMGTTSGIAPYITGVWTFAPGGVRMVHDLAHAPGVTAEPATTDAHS